MKKEYNEIIKRAIEFAEKIFRDDFSGHDISHTLRVLSLASEIAEKENADALTVQLGAVLHDVDDKKLSKHTYQNKDNARNFLENEGFDKEHIEKIIKIISDVSFVGTDSVKPDSLEGCCVQDADRLDAIGAIGIARAFAYGASRKREMYNPNIKPVLNANADEYEKSGITTINHFYEKLFLLKDMLNTDSAKQIAEKRDLFMHEFIDEFLEEWNV